MTEKLKYKVGDKVWIEAEVKIVGTTPKYRYGLAHSKTGNFLRWFSADELDKVSVTSPPKPKIPQAKMEWYEEYENERADWRISDWLSDINTLEGMDEWLYGENHLHNQHALATLIAYGPGAVEVEKEKKYRIFVKNITTLNGYKQCLVYFGGNYSISQYNKDLDKKYHRDEFTRQEIIKAGFGDVFDNHMFEVEEVE